MEIFSSKVLKSQYCDNYNSSIFGFGCSLKWEEQHCSDSKDRIMPRSSAQIVWQSTQ